MDGTPNMADLFGRMAEMQQRVADTQARLAEERVTAEAGGGMVAVTADGAGRVVSIKIDPAAVDPSDLELLEDLVVAGVNKALEQAEAIKAAKMQQAATSMLPPGLDLGSLGL
jgi:DNA-binding YbaB/EbfC family protein